MKRIFITRLIIIAITMFFFGCGLNRDNTSGKTGVPINSINSTFLVENDINPSSYLKTLTAIDIQSFMANNTNFYANPPDSDISEDRAIKCLNLVLDRIVIEASITSMVIAGKVDFDKFNECYNAEEKTKKVPSTTFEINLTGFYKIYYEITCEGGDLSSFNGLGLSKLYNLNINGICIGPKRTYIGNFEQNMTYITTSEDQTFTLKVSDKSVGIFHNNGNHCIETLTDNVWILENGCIDVSRNIPLNFEIVINGETQPDEDENLKEEYIKIEFINIKQNNDTTTPFYVSGEMSITYNNWIGKVIFDGSKSPVWEMSDGSKTEQGNLTAMISKPVKDIIRKLKLRLKSPGRK